VPRRPFASAISSARVPYRRARPFNVSPRATVWVRKVTCFSGGSAARQSATFVAAPAGTFSGNVRLAGVASRRSSGLRLLTSATSASAHSATTRRSTALSTDTVSKGIGDSGVISKP
jgi:hypothetical protein